MMAKLAHKMNVVASKAARGLKHKVNAMRNHEELRDMLVEMKAYPKAAHRAAKYYSVAIVGLTEFASVHANLSSSIKDTFQTLHEQLLADVDKSCLRTNEICLALEAILDKEKALSDASKAAAKDKLDDSTREKLKELEEKLEKELAAVRLEKIRVVIKEMGLMQMEIFDHIIKTSAQQLELIESGYSGENGSHTTFEELWDEARPALGNPVAKPTPPADGSKRAPWEDLATLSRPVDGDTRIKYAQKWNDIVKSTLSPFREGSSQLAVLAAIRKKFSGFFAKWAKEDEDMAGKYDVVVEKMTEMDNKFAESILYEYNRVLEATPRALEPHMAIVPVVKAQTGNPDKDILNRRAKDTKGAIINAIESIRTAATSAKADVLAYGAVAMPALPTA